MPLIQATEAPHSKVNDLKLHPDEKIPATTTKLVTTTISAAAGTNGVPPGDVAGIVVGITAALVLVGAAIFIVFVKRNRGPRDSPPQNESQPWQAGLTYPDDKTSSSTVNGRVQSAE